MDEQHNSAKKSNIIPVVVAIAIIIVLAAGVMAYQSMNTQSSNEQLTTLIEESQIPEDNMETTVEEYEDGTYSAVGNYTSPGGAEELGVSLTIADGVITEAEVETKATRPTSKTKQEDFAANYKPLVIGKNIDDVELTKVSGSSLSPKGFNDALEKIRSQAQVVQS